MKKINKIAAALVILLVAFACTDYPIDEDDLLVTERSECYVSNFDIAGTDRVSVRVGSADIDTTACTVRVTVHYGTDLKHVYPQFTLVSDAKLEPKITGMEDYSDLDHPKQYTVVSGSRKVRKTYTVYVTPEKKQ
jgi:hypothetical protein